MGRRHVPAYRRGCFDGRLEHACPLCQLRILWWTLTGPRRDQARPARNAADTADGEERPTIGSVRERAAPAVSADLPPEIGREMVTEARCDAFLTLVAADADTDDRLRPERSTGTPGTYLKIYRVGDGYVVELGDDAENPEFVAVTRDQLPAFAERALTDPQHEWVVVDIVEDSWWVPELDWQSITVES